MSDERVAFRLAVGIDRLTDRTEKLEELLVYFLEVQSSSGPHSVYHWPDEMLKKFLDLKSKVDNRTPQE